MPDRAAPRPGVPSPGVPRSRLRVLAALLGTTSLVLAACGADPGAAPGTSTGTGGTTSSGAYPLTVDNCGTEVTFTAPPGRVVTVKSAPTETLFALGAGDAVVATAYPDGPAPEPWTQAVAALPVLSDRVPSGEVVLAQEPELVYAGWESVFSADGAGERSTLEDQGVRTLVAPSACKAAGYRPDPLTFDDVFAEIELVGRIMDRDEEASALVAEQRAELDDIVPDGRGLSALWFSSGSDTPYVGGGTGAPALVMATAGLDNVADDIDDSWGPMSWEAVAGADPDVIVLVDSPWNSAEKKIGVLEGDPVTAELRAVRARAYVTIPFPATEAGVRTVSAARDLARQVTALPAED